MRLKSISLSAALLLAGCANGPLSTTQTITPVEHAPQGFASWTDAVPAYRLQPGDKLKIQFQLTPEMGEDAVVGPDGAIGLRAAGRLIAAGRTVAQLQDDIAQGSSQILSRPIVTVSLVESPGSPIFVGGAVGHPGAYNITGRRGSFEAVQLAGGFGPEARMDEVVLIRRDPTNKPMLKTVDLRSLVDGSETHPDVPLLAGDIVFVPRNRISEVDLWIDQFVNKLLPFNKSLDYTINRSPY